MSSSTETVIYGLTPTDPAYSSSNTHGTHYGPIETHDGQEPALEFFAGPIAPQPSSDRFLHLATFDPSLSRDGFTFKDPRPGIYDWRGAWTDTFRKACVRASKDLSFSSDEADMQLPEFNTDRVFARLKDKTYDFDGSVASLYIFHDPVAEPDRHDVHGSLWSIYSHRVDHPEHHSSGMKQHADAALWRAINQSRKKIATLNLSGCSTGVSIRRKLEEALLIFDEDLQNAADSYKYQPPQEKETSEERRARREKRDEWKAQTAEVFRQAGQRYGH